MILGWVDGAIEAGARQWKACEVLGIHERTLQRWRAMDVNADRRRGPKSAPGNKLTDAERAKVLETVNSSEFRDLSPRQIVPHLADLGEYVASEATIYRILHDEDQMAHRESSKPPRKVAKPREHVATGPNQVWSWDITYMRSPVTGRWYHLYLVMDVWSRKIVGWAVHEVECAGLAAALIDEIHMREEIGAMPLVLHSDNGSPMKGSTMLATLQALGVVKSFSRPSVSDDNPYSESLFRTLKYRPGYPRGGFGSIEAAREWVSGFTTWYNDVHHHSGIRFVTPSQRHEGRDIEILGRRAEVYKQARDRNPTRWSGATRNWTPVDAVVLNPGNPSGAKMVG